MAKRDKILICGFSGAGKTSLLQELKRTSNDPDWFFDDLDQLIIKTFKVKDIDSLISIHGWEKFRLWERQALEGWLKNEGRGVLALGGGALTSALYELYNPIRQVGFCYLHAPFEDCWKRLNLETSEFRPLLKIGKRELEKVYEERQKVFSRIPWRLENSEESNIQLLAQKFWEEIDKY